MSVYSAKKALLRHIAESDQPQEDVCGWTHVYDNTWESGCTASEHPFLKGAKPNGECFCGKPIKVKE